MAGKRVLAHPTAAGTTVPAAARTMALFEVFAKECRELTKSELARLLNLPESSCSDLLNTLHELGYVSRTANTKRFYPTMRLLGAATAISANDPLGLFGAEAVAVLAERVGETCSFGILDGARVKIISVQEGNYRLRYVVQPGDRVSLHGTALGKALLAQLNPAERARLLRLQPLQRLTPDTQTNPAAVEREIELGERRGFHKSEGEGSPGVWSLAVGGHLGTLPVGLTMIGPTERIQQNRDEFLRIIEEVRQQVFGSEAPAAEKATSRGRAASDTPAVGKGAAKRATSSRRQKTTAA